MKLYYLRNIKTGLYFNGINFNAKDIQSAQALIATPSQAQVSLAWSNFAVETWEFPYSTAIRLSS